MSYYDVFDPNYYIYLNPELYYYNGINTVELAYDHYVNGTGLASNLLYSRDELPSDFDYTVYQFFYSSNINSNNSGYIDSNIRDFLLNSNELERLSIIHYLREGRYDNTIEFYSVSSNFNPHLYRIAHQITDENLTDDQLYHHYLEKKITDPIVVGSVYELGIYVASNFTLEVNDFICNRDSTFKNDLFVWNNAYFTGEVAVSTEGFTVDGGTITLGNFGNLNTVLNFPQNIPFKFTANTFSVGNSNFYTSNGTMNYLDDMSNILVMIMLSHI